MTLDEMGKRLKATEKCLAEMQKRLRVVEDIEEIKQLTISYINCLCFGKFDHIMDHLSENFMLDLGKPNQPQDIPARITGKAAVKKFYKELAKGHVGDEGTYVVHPIISVSGDIAKGKWVLYINYRFPRTGQSLFWIQTEFEPEYIRENGKWKFSVIKARERLGIPGGETPVELFSKGTSK